jgi:hypothetical protein
MNKPKFDLTSVDGNAFSLMGGWQRAARKAGWTPEEIEKVIKECKSGDYDHLVQTLMKNSD